MRLKSGEPLFNFCHSVFCTGGHMTKKDIIERATRLAAPLAAAEGFELWAVDYYKDPVGWNLLASLTGTAEFPSMTCL